MDQNKFWYSRLNFKPNFLTIGSAMASEKCVIYTTNLQYTKLNLMQNGPNDLD